MALITTNLNVRYEEGNWEWCKTLITTCTEWVVEFQTPDSIIDEWWCCSSYVFGWWSGWCPDDCPTPTWCLPSSCLPWPWPFFIGVSTWCTNSSYYNLDQIKDLLGIFPICDTIYDCVRDILVEWQCISIRASDTWVSRSLTIWVDVECILSQIQTDDILWSIAEATCDYEYDIGVVWKQLNFEEVDCESCDDTCTPKVLEKCWNTYQWNCKDKERGELYSPWIGMYLTQAVDVYQPTTEETKYYLAGAEIPEMEANWFERIPSNRNDRWRRNYIMQENGIVEICVPGDYDLIMLGATEVNKGIHAYRMWLAVIMWTWEVPLSANETRYSAMSDPPYPHQTPWVWNINNWSYGDNFQTTQIGWPNNTLQYSMGRIIERWPINSIMSIPLPLWARIVPILKVSTFMTGDDEAAIEWQLSVISVDTAFGWWGWAFHYQVKSWNDVYTRCKLVEKYGFKKP